MNENTKQTLMAFVRLGCTFAAAAAAMAGFALDANALFVGASCIISAGFFVWSWWKNNNVTTAATEAQEVLDLIKAQGSCVLDPVEFNEGDEIDG